MLSWYLTFVSYVFKDVLLYTQTNQKHSLLFCIAFMKTHRNKGVIHLYAICDPVRRNPFIYSLLLLFIRWKCEDRGYEIDTYKIRVFILGENCRKQER